MQQMISIINENLKSVINGIISHRESTERDLVIVKNEMDEKINIASKYKEEVIKSRDKITGLENDISDLENDLEELNNKFAAKNLKEIINVGNKEINAKILEKRSLISNETENISELTEKALKLKEDLVVLKEKKIVTEQNLENALALEKYYSDKISSMIEYSENHIEVLKGYGLSEEYVSNTELENANIENNVDGSIFEEIENIDETEIDEYESDEESEYEIQLEEGSIKEDSLSIELDRIIEEANELIIRSNELEEKTNTYIDKYKDNEDDEEQSSEDPQITFTDESIESEINFDLEDETKETSLSVVNENDDIIPYVGESDLEQLMKNEEFDPVIVSEEIPEDIFKVEDYEDIFSDVEKDLEEEPEIGIDIFKTEEEPEFEKNDDIFDSKEEPEINEDIFVDEETNENKVEEENDDFIVEESFSVDAPEIGDLLSEDEINKTFEEMLKEDIDSTIEPKVIEKEDVKSEREIITNETSKDKVAEILKRNGVSSANIENVSKYFDKVNTIKLEKNIMKNRDKRLTDLIYQAYEGNIEENLSHVLELTDKEISKLKSNVSNDEYKELNMFSKLVKRNVECLSKYRIDNLKDCILTHPLRFLDNPDDFEEMLDKYDEDDLVRCINKNPAVLDKL